MIICPKLEFLHESGEYFQEVLSVTLKPTKKNEKLYVKNQN